MSTLELAKKVVRWTRDYGFIGDVEHNKYEHCHVVGFVARTTKTRASSMVTRLKLMTSELAGKVPYSVHKELASDPPDFRDSLSSWKIFVILPTQRSKRW